MGATAQTLINITRRQAVLSFTSPQPASPMEFTVGDTLLMQIALLADNPATLLNQASPQIYLDPAAFLPLTWAISVFGLLPTAGTQTATFGANTTSALAYNVSTASLSTALNALASVIAAGGVTVSGTPGSVYVISFVTPGVVANLIEFGAELLYPASNARTRRETTGAAGINEVQVVTITQTPAVVQNDWTAVYPATTVTRTQAGGSGKNEIQTITMPAGTAGGSLSFAFGGANTPSQVSTVTGSALEAALVALSTIGTSTVGGVTIDNVSVVQTSPTTWDVTFQGALANEGQPLIVVNDSALQKPMYLEGTIDLSGQQLVNLLGGNASISAGLQVVLDVGTGPSTVLSPQSNPVTINNGFVFGTPTTPIPGDPLQTLSQVDALIAAAISASGYVLTPATPTVIGGVIIPASGSTVSSLSIDGSGNLTVSTPTATTAAKGVVRVDGTSITINPTTGIISATPGGSVPLATDTTAGTVIVPTAGNLTVDGSGNIAVPAASSSVFGVIKTSTGLTSTAGVVTLNKATQTTLGGVIVPSTSNLSIDGSGNLTLATATNSVLGVCRPDNLTITIAGGVLTAAVPAAATTGALGTIIVGGGLAISGGVLSVSASITGGLGLQGTWNANTNTPTLASGVGTAGYYYIVSVAGTTNLDGNASWLPGDQALYNGAAWERIPSGANVASVNGRTGAVTLSTSDIAGLATVASSGSASDLTTGTLARARMLAATSALLGGLIVPSGGYLAVDGSGNLTCTIPNASASVFGLAKVDGTTIAATAGVLSVISSGTPIATSTTVGTVKVPVSGGLTVDGSGNIRVPQASTTAKGVVQVDGTSILIDPATGIISATPGGSVPTATTSTLGVIKVGAGLTIASGFLTPNPCGPTGPTAGTCSGDQKTISTGTGVLIAGAAPVTPAYASSIAIDCSYGLAVPATITGNVTLTTTNLRAGGETTIVMTADSGGPYTVTVPGGWNLVQGGGGAAAPTTIAASKKLVLSLLSTGTADAGVIATWGAS